MLSKVRSEIAEKNVGEDILVLKTLFIQGFKFGSLDTFHTYRMSLIYSYRLL